MPASAGLSGSNGGKKRKVLSREARYKKIKAAEAAARSSNGKKNGLNNTGKGKARKDDDDIEEDPHPFRYKSFNDRLASVHINVATSLGRSGTGAIAGLDGHGLASTSFNAANDESDEDDDPMDEGASMHAKTSFGIALQTWKELNLSLPFTSLAHRIQPLSLSLPLLLHNQVAITDMLQETLHNSYPDSYLAYEPVLDLIPRLANDLGSACLPSYAKLLTALLRITTIDKLQTEGQEYTAAMLVERSFESIAAMLRSLAPFILREKQSKEGELQDWLEVTWHLIRPFLGYQDAWEALVNDNVYVETNSDSDSEEVLAKKGHDLRRKKIPIHTRRFASEALAHLVRRAKPNQLNRIAYVMMNDVQMAFISQDEQKVVKLNPVYGFTAGVAGVWAEVTKSVEGRIHSMAATYLQTALTRNLSTVSLKTAESASRARIVVGTFLITSLCHHAQSAELIPVFNWIADTLEARITNLSLSSIEGAHQTIEWMIAFVGTRKGKRVDDGIKSRLYGILLRLAEVMSVDESQKDEYRAIRTSAVQLISIAMPIARIQDLIGPCLKIISVMAPKVKGGRIPIMYSAVVMALASLDFSGFQQVVLPSVLEVTADILEDDVPKSSATADALNLLSGLDSQDKLSNVSGDRPNATSTRWQNLLGRFVERCIVDLSGHFVSLTTKEMATISSEQMACVSLSGYVPTAHAMAVVNHHCTFIGTLSKLEQGQIEGQLYAEHIVNPNALISLSLQSLSKLITIHGSKIAKHVISKLSVILSLEDLLITRAWHRQIVIAIANIVIVSNQRGAKFQMTKLDELIRALEASAASTDEELRLASMQILSFASLTYSEANPSVFTRLVEVEEKGLAVETVRERNVLLRSIGRDLGRMKATKTTEELPKWFVPSTGPFVIRIIVSTMKLNLKPLWEESRQALIDLSGQFGQDVWSVAFSELRDTSVPFPRPNTWDLALKDLSQTNNFSSQALLEAFNETIDKQFQDPQLVERRGIVLEAAHDSAVGSMVEKQMEKGQLQQGRLDLINYQVQILSLFASIATMAERNNAPLMQHFFLTIVERESVEEGAEDEESEAEEEEEISENDNQTHISLTRNQRRDQLCAYLETFAKFSNPKALSRSSELHTFLSRLLTQGDAKVQRLSLNVILQWKDPAHTSNAELLKKLLSPNEFREQLTSLILTNTPESTIQPGHRASFLPLLLRLMFGIIISKQSRASGQANRKSAILSAIAELEPMELQPLIDVMLEPFEDISGSKINDLPPSASQRVQNGYITLLEDVIKYLGLRIIPFWPKLLNVLINITHHASLRAIQKGQGRLSQAERSLRQNGLRRLNEFFRQPTDAFDWQPFLPTIFAHLIEPRLALLRSESIQSPSVVLEILHTWSGKQSLVINLVSHVSSTIGNVTKCLEAPGVKSSVIKCILDIIENVVSFSEGDPQDEGDDEDEDPFEAEVEQSILRPNISAILKGIDSLIRRCDASSPIEAKALGRDEILRRVLNLLSRMASYIEVSDDISSLFALLGPLLRKNNVIISEKSKSEVLIVLEELMPKWLIDQSASKDDVKTLYMIFTSLFSRLHGRIARTTLVRAFGQFGQHDPSLRQTIKLVEDLNAFDVKRMQEYDFDRRLSAFDTINAETRKAAEERLLLNPLQWMPLLHNFVFFLQDPDELAIRASSGTAIRRFIDTLETHSEQEKSQDGTTIQELQQLFTNVVFSGLRRSIRSPSELVRREAIETIGYAVSHLSSQFSNLKEMQPLLFEGDEEANFFNNIEHIQTHRKVRALTRLGQVATSGQFKTRTITDILMPMVEHFLRTDINHGDGNLIQKAVECLGQLASQLNWGPYNVLLWKYLSFNSKKREKEGKDDDKEKPEISEKVSVRAALGVLENFHFKMDEDVKKDSDEMQEDEDVLPEAVREEALQQSRKVLDAVRNRLLPRLMECLDLKDEMEDTVRLPIAVGVARIALQLPDQYRRSEVLRLLNTMGHVFRSKAQDTRDLARSTLAKVAMTLGPKYFGDMVIELRKILTRGPQIAVLAFTVHNVLLHCIEASQSADEENQLSNLDERTTTDVVEVIIEDIFGRTAEDRQSIENRTTYKEVKATRSMDTLEQLARIVAPTSIRAMLVPLKELMSQTEAAQATRNFDDCLRKMAIGLQSNPHLDPHEYLIFCHEVLSASNTSLYGNRIASRDTKKSKASRRTSAILSKRLDVEQEAGKRDHFAHNAHRFIVFGLDLLSSSLRKGKFDFTEASLLAKLDPLVNAVGNGLYANQTNVIAHSVRCLTLLVKCPLPSVQEALPTIVKQTMKLVQREGNTRSDILMACLKLLTVIVRDVDGKGDREMPLLNEKQLIMLCRLIELHIEEDVEMQGTLFNMLRALIVRKLTVAELYDLMDKVANMLIVQQSESVRSACRATFLDFLLNLPQGQKRFSNQIHFLIKNLDYVYESGRLSVLTFLRTLFEKISEDVLRPYFDLMFVALVMRLANDESSTCREKSSLLIKRIIDASGQEELSKFVTLTQTWSQSSLDQETGRTLLKVSMMVFALMMESNVSSDVQEGTSKSWQEIALIQSTIVLDQYASCLEQKETDADEAEWEDDDEILSDWQVPYQTLQLVTRIFKQRKEIWSENEERDVLFDDLWPGVTRLLLFPHSWVRLAACRSLGEQFGTRKPKAPANAVRLEGMVNTSKKLSLILRSSQVDEALSLQVIKNLVFIGKCFAEVDSHNDDGAEKDAEEDDESEDEELGEKEDPLWRKQPLRWLFNILSHQLRKSGAEHAHISESGFLSSSAILKCMAAIMSHLDVTLCERYLIHTITPLYRILETNVSIGNIKGSKHGDVAGAERRSTLESLAREVQELIQAKVGTQLFASTYGSIKKKANEKRHQRRAQAIQRGIEFPEQMAVRAAKRNVKKHESRKRKHDNYAKAKERVRPSKRPR